jgi:hypothetical protein
MAGFQRLAQCLEHAAVEFGQFVEKQHAVVRQRDFTGLRHGTATHQSGRAGRMVRRAKWTLGKPCRVEQAGTRQHGCRFERLALVHVGQQAVDACCQHGLAGAGRPRHQQGMTPGSGDFERTARLKLPAYVSQIRV